MLRSLSWQNVCWNNKQLIVRKTKTGSQKRFVLVLLWETLTTRVWQWWSRFSRRTHQLCLEQSANTQLPQNRQVTRMSSCVFVWRDNLKNLILRITGILPNFGSRACANVFRLHVSSASFSQPGINWHWKQAINNIHCDDEDTTHNPIQICLFVNSHIHRVLQNPKEKKNKITLTVCETKTLHYARVEITPISYNIYKHTLYR